MPTMLYRGKAINGPRHGVELSAPLTWDGRVGLPRRTDAEATRYYPGRYVWSERGGAWRWEELPPDAYCKYDSKAKRTIHRWPHTARAGEKCLCGGNQLFIKKR